MFLENELRLFLGKIMQKICENFDPNKAKEKILNILIKNHLLENFANWLNPVSRILIELIMLEFRLV